MKSVLGRGISVFGESSCFLFAHELSCHMKLLFCMYAGIHRKQFCMALNSYKFYTTGIMTTAENCVILGYRKKISGGRELHRKEKDMTTMYRFDQLHSERKSLALLKDHEWALITCAHLRLGINEKIVFLILHLNRRHSRTGV